MTDAVDLLLAETGVLLISNNAKDSAALHEQEDHAASSCTAIDSSRTMTRKDWFTPSSW